jgi:hypothetical protein
MDLVIGGILEQSFGLRTMECEVSRRTKAKANANAEGKTRAKAGPPPAAKDDN